VAKNGLKTVQKWPKWGTCGVAVAGWQFAAGADYARRRVDFYLL
jgi:hypothetical protein